MEKQDLLLMNNELLEKKCFIFLAGLHKSGTTLLHEILRSHPEISGFANTGVPMDEGQHLQTLFEPALKFGGPGRFACDEKAYMDESHILATDENAKILFDQWSSYWDMRCRFLLEKSPPNIIRTRFLQKLFPRSKFVVIMRHPAVVALATQKWCAGRSLPMLIDHTLKAYTIFFADKPFLHDVFVLRYEHFIRDPQRYIEDICRFIGIPPFHFTQNIQHDINTEYFIEWKKYIHDTSEDILSSQELERRFNMTGYSIHSATPLSVGERGTPEQIL